MLILWVFETDVFSCSERLVCYIKSPKSVFHDLFSRSMKWEYRRLQGVTKGSGGYKGLQGVTWGYNRLHGVTRTYRESQRIIETFV